MGSARFHLPYMLEVLEAERRYRDAYRLLAEFSDLLVGWLYHTTGAQHMKRRRL